MTSEIQSEQRESPLRDEHDHLAASWTELGGRRVPGHYGADPAAIADEYRAAIEACALVDLPERGLLEVSGPKRSEFLQRILSNEVADLQPGSGRLAALMNTKGQLLALLRVLVAPQRIVIELHRDCLERVAETLEHYRVAAPVRFGRPASSTLALVGPSAPELLERVGLRAPTDANGHAAGELDGHSVKVCRASDLPRGTFVLHVDSQAAERVWHSIVAAGARPLGRHAFDALRIEQGRALYGFDVDEANLLHETGLLDEYHSPAKGCYVGQEVVARLEARGGNVSRRLRGLRLSAPAMPGNTIESGGENVGSLTTTAVSPRCGPIAMGYLHRSAAEPGQRVSVATAAATVAALPLEGAAGETG